MSNYPPTPSFGVSFEQPGRPPNDAVNSMHLPNQATIHRGSFIPPSIQTMNAFQKNATLPVFDASRMEGVSMTPLVSQGYMPYGPIPPVPFPSVSAGQPMWPMPFPLFVGPSSQQHLPLPQLPFPQLTSDPTQPTTTATEKAPVSNSWGWDREEGELSEADTATSPPSAEPVANQMATKVAKAVQAAAPGPRRLSSLGKNPRKVILPSNGGARSAPVPTRRPDSAMASQPPTEIRDKAKDAILSLLPYYIGFEQYVAEGVREDTLTALYNDLGLEVPLTPSAQQTPSRNQPHATKATLDKPIGRLNGHTDQQAAPAPVSETASRKAIAVSAGAPASTAKSRSGGFPVQMTKDSLTNGDTPQAQPPKSLASSLPNSTNNPAVNGSVVDSSKRVKAGESQVERKHLILQKLAAKRGMNLPHSVRSRDAPAATVADSLKPTVTGESELPKPTDVRQESDTNNHLSARPPITRSEALETQSLLDSSSMSQERDTSMKFVEDSTNVTSEKKPATTTTTSILEKDTNGTQPHNTPRGKTSPNHSQSTPNLSQNIKQPSSLKASTSYAGIPGLFMTSPSIRPETPQSTTVPLSNTLPSIRAGPRKRPVAADFDTEPVPATGSFKRPFGHSRVEQPLVINVSEDESAEEEDENGMDVDENPPSIQPTHLTQAQTAPEDQKRMSIRDMPPLTDVPTTRRTHIRKLGPGPTSVPGTPPIDVTGGKGTIAAQEDLKRKEQQIQLMQKKIAEFELRKALQSKSRAQTPTKPAAIPLRPKTPSPPVLGEAPAPPAEDPSVLERSRQTEEDVKKLAAVKAAEEEEMRRVSKAKSEERNRRRAEIESGLSLTKAEVEKEKTRLENLRLEREKCETSVQAALSKKERLELELQRLEVEDKSSSDQSQKEPWGLNPEPEQGVISPPTAGRGGADWIAAPEIYAGAAIPNVEVPHEEVIASIATAKGHQLHTNASIDSDSEPSTEAPVVEGNNDQSISQLEREVPQLSDDPEMTKQNTPTDQQPSETSELEHSLERDGSDHGRHDPPTNSETTSLSSAMEIDPESLSSASRNPRGVSDDTSRRGESERDCAYTSLRGSSDEGDIQERDGLANLNEVSEESDSYEPPEQMPSDLLKQQTMNTPPFSPAPARTPPSYDSTPKRSSARSSLELFESPPLASAGSNSLKAVQESAEARDLADAHMTADVSRLTPQGHFKPYLSPLRHFRSYRYHPKYLEEVSGGFRSLTFSHKIDPAEPLCKYEASGGVCNDDSCEGQHFRDMGLSGALGLMFLRGLSSQLASPIKFPQDDLILVEMGSVKEGSTPEEEAQYMAGLKKTLQGLPAHKVRDISTVAAEIAAYRSRFLKDDSRVLILNPQHPKARQLPHFTGASS